LVFAFGLIAEPPANFAANVRAPSPNGAVLVAKVTGHVTIEIAGKKSDVKSEQRVPAGATISTAAYSSVMLAFSNGATVRLSPNSALLLEEFLQDPFSGSVKVTDITEEPTSSRTKLRLLRGEIEGVVKRLHVDQDSVFRVRAVDGEGEKSIEVTSGVFRFAVTPAR
jgi:hypothetical protein